ncbi:Os04g0386400 [Oryza sativa Japonica Group]|uniref:Os04g0386400 protein n=1 Tax=Oryza sativa subsp. japonica TaxID=39947 RepID=A0A0N7KIY7_ORYSJ|nr:Os04g0386400 [Oryza sativa Japonica Group]
MGSRCNGIDILTIVLHEYHRYQVLDNTGTGQQVSHRYWTTSITGIKYHATGTITDIRYQGSKDMGEVKKVMRRL